MREKKPSQLGDELRGIRARRGWSLRDVEKRTGINNAAISQIETGHTKDPSFVTVAKLALFYNVDLRALAKMVINDD